MKAIELLKVGSELLKLMSTCDLLVDDWKNIAMYEEYTALRKAGEKCAYITAMLSEKYKVSESTVKRVVKRLSDEVTA